MTIDFESLFVFSTYSLRAFLTLFWGVFLIFYRKRSRQNFPLSCVFILIGLLYLRNGFVRVPSVCFVDVYNPLSYLVLIFIAPFTIFYVYFSIAEKHTTKHYLLHFAPFIITLFLWVFLIKSNINKVPFCYSIEDIFKNIKGFPIHTTLFLLTAGIFIAQVFIYSSMAFKRFFKIRKNYKFHKLPLRPINRLIIITFLFTLYSLICIVFMSYNNNIFLGMVHNIWITAVVTAISVMNMNLILPLKTDLSFSEKKIPKNQNIIPVLNKNKADKNFNPKLAKQIKDLFEEKELFRLNDITLNDIAIQLGSNRTYVSMCINQYYGCSFSQIINKYRIEAAKKLLLNSDLDIQQIAEEAGFNTRRSFYNAFKEFVSENTSPSEWRKSKYQK